MKKILRRSLCCLLSIVLAFSTIVTAVAYDEDAQTSPVIVVNDINLNPIRNTDDGTVVFSFSDYQFDPLFTTGFSENITDLFTKETIEEITNGDLAALEIVTLLLDYFGFSGDVNRIINTVLELIMKVSENLATSGLDIQEMISNINFESFADSLKNKLAGKLEEIKLLSMNPDGTPLYDNIGAVVFEDSLEYLYDEYEDLAYEIAGEIADSIAEAIGYENTYIFNYDWRLDPMKHADDLNAYIENVKKEKGSDKVTLIPCSMGGTVTNSYLYKYGTKSVNKVIYAMTAIQGLDAVGEVFHRNIDVNVDVLMAYLFSMQRDDLAMQILMSAIASFTEITPAITKWVDRFIDESLDELNDRVYDELMCISFGTLPGFWSLVPDSYYDEAKDIFFGGKINKTFEGVIDNYHNNVQAKAAEIMQGAIDEGVEIYVLASYGYVGGPYTKAATAQSDCLIETANQSLWATTAPYGESFGKDYAAKGTVCSDKSHNHVSTDGIVDASTCAFPFRTWFVKGLSHTKNTGEYNAFSNRISQHTSHYSSRKSCRGIWQANRSCKGYICKRSHTCYCSTRKHKAAAK